MIDAAAVRELIETYARHGWILRRVLLSPALAKALGKYKHELFAEAAVSGSDLDAAWFSRPPKTGDVAWEIRYLGDIPFALLESMDESSDELESRLKGLESRMRETIAAKREA